MLHQVSLSEFVIQKQQLAELPVAVSFPCPQFFIIETKTKQTFSKANKIQHSAFLFSQQELSLYDNNIIKDNE